MPFSLRTKAGFTALLLLLAAGCADYAPVPGGTDSVNSSFYDSKDELLTRLEGLTPGMPEKEVMTRLKRREGELVRMRRDDIMTALLGSNLITFQDDAARENILHELYGYKLNFKFVKRRHGFTSPIRVRTDEKGFNYTVTLIFYEGLLFEKPLVSGGVVNESSSKTVFDFLSPGTIVDQTIK